MVQQPTIAVLMACHNRRAKTLACLDSLQAQAVEATLRIHLLDDASQDGTAEAVRHHHPTVRLIRGRGDAFWAGGMRAAFLDALAEDPDYYLWLNDDVRLAPDALMRLLAVDGALRAGGSQLHVIGGAVADPRSGTTSYGGVERVLIWHPLRFRACGPHPDAPRPCDTLVGNVVLIPRSTVRRIGIIGRHYSHTLGDLDYGLRVSRAGGLVALAPGHVGTCESNRGGHRWFNPALPLRDRWRVVGTPLGFPLRPWLHFVRQHGGPVWPLFVLPPYWRLLVPPTLINSLRILLDRVSRRTRQGSHVAAR